MQTRGGNVSTYLTAAEWEALEKYIENLPGSRPGHPLATRHSVLKAALRAYLKLDK